MNPSPKTRTRLTPEARKKQLLSVAKQMILEQGLQSFSMEALARTAGVSSPLVYNYFSSRKATLRELLTREYTAYADNLTAAVAAADSFEEVVRIFITSNFDHYAPGNIIPILDSQPEIVEAIHESSSKHGREVARFLVRATATNYRLTKIQAELVVRMSSGASIAAAEYAALGRMPRDKAIDVALAYVMAGLKQIATRET